LAQRAASALVTMREGQRAGFNGPASGAWPPRAWYLDGVWMQWRRVARLWPYSWEMLALCGTSCLSVPGRRMGDGRSV